MSSFFLLLLHRSSLRPSDAQCAVRFKRVIPLHNDNINHPTKSSCGFVSWRTSPSASNREVFEKACVRGRRFYSARRDSRQTRKPVAQRPTARTLNGMVAIQNIFVGLVFSRRRFVGSSLKRHSLTMGSIFVSSKSQHRTVADLSRRCRILQHTHGPCHSSTQTCGLARGMPPRS